MEINVLIGALLGFPLVMGLLFRISASQVFFSIMASELLARYFGHEAEVSAAKYLENSEVAPYGEAIVFILPLLLTCIFLRGSVSSGRAILAVIPLALTGVVFAAFMLPIMPADIQEQALATPIGNYIINMDTLIIGGVVIIQLLGLWFFDREEGFKKKHHKRKKD